MTVIVESVLVGGIRAANVDLSLLLDICVVVTLLIVNGCSYRLGVVIVQILVEFLMFLRSHFYMNGYF